MTDGQQATLSQLSSEGFVTLVFVRHVGCMFCKQQVALLRDAGQTQVVIVAPSSDAQTRSFGSQMHWPGRMIADPDGQLFKAAALVRGNLGSFLSPHVLAQGFKALKGGHFNGVPEGDALQLGGVVISRDDGEVVFRRPARDAADLVEPSELQAAILEIAGV